MHPTSALATTVTLALPPGSRWHVYRRLQELAIPCVYSPYEPLRVEVDHGLVALQVWSVVKQWNAPRAELLAWLNTCWAAAR